MTDNASGWTIDTLYQHMTAMLSEAEKRNEQRFDGQQEAISAALLSAEKAVTKAEAGADKRFDSVNEFRQTLTDQATTFMPRNEAAGRSASRSPPW